MSYNYNINNSNFIVSEAISGLLKLKKSTAIVDIYNYNTYNNLNIIVDIYDYNKYNNKKL